MSYPPDSPSAPLERTLSHGVSLHRLPVDEEGTFPQLTEAGPHTDAFQEETPSGLVLASEAESNVAAESTLAASVSPKSRRRLSQSTLVSSHEARGEKGVADENAIGLPDAKLVTWREGDPENPRNWSYITKWIQTILPSTLCFTSGFASAIITGGLHEMAVHFHVGDVVMNLSVTVFVVGFGLGPLVLSPLSEMYGRRIIYVTSMFLFFIFTLPECITDSIAVLMVFRFIAGCMASGVMCNAAGSIGDLWAVNSRGNKMAVFSSILFASPCLGPLVGGFVTDTVGWRWMWWVLFIFSGCSWAICSVFLRETYAPALLRWRAQKLRKETGDASIMTEQERLGRPLSDVVRETLLRPLVMLTTEPIMTFFSAYLCLIYALLYAFFFLYPLVLAPHGFSNGEVGLAFLSILIGIFIVVTVACPMQERYYQRRVAESPDGNVPPEARLPLMMGCSAVLPMSLFIFGATSSPHVHWAGAVVSGIPFGFALVGIYISANTYIAVAFSQYSASAMAAKTFIRSMAGASTPMWIPGMYHNIGPWWSGATLAFIAVMMCPIPFVFFFYGARIRRSSKMASG
ncbi:hypothetical protein JCM1840_001396 [Sporobolomyces johnsonii]